MVKFHPIWSHWQEMPQKLKDKNVDNFIGVIVQKLMHF
jgi:hypothetical protein